MQRDGKKFIRDALIAAEELRGFTAGKSLADVESDRGLQLIIEREFEILGEALARFRNTDDNAFAGISEGHRIIGTRNLLAHGYDVVDYRVLWDAIQQDLPCLIGELEDLLDFDPRADD